MKRDVKRTAEEIKSDQIETSYIQPSSLATEPGNPALFSTLTMSQPDVRILLVEDDAQTRDYLHRLLATQWTVEMVSDGAAALAAACVQPPDLVLTDVLMPGMDGLTLLRELRATPQTKNVPIILFSGQASEETMIEGFAAGADDYLIKPFSGQELLGRVGARLGLNRLRRQAEADRQAAYAQAQAEQKRVIHILESISDAFATLDEEYRYIYINHKAEDLVKKLVGKSKLDLLGQSIWDIFPRLATSRSGEQYRRAMTERVAVHFEDYFRPLNAWFDVHIYPSQEGLSVYFQEITSRKQAEQALRESEERFRTLVTTTTAVLWATDPTGAFVAPQPSWEAYTGQVWPEYEGWKRFAMFHPDDRAKIEAEWHEAVATETIYEATGRVWHAASGEYHFFISRGVPVRRADGTIREWVGVLTDLHEQKQLERALQLSEERFRIAQELSLDAYTILKAVRSATGEIIDFVWEYVNPAAERILLRPKEELLGQRLLQVLPGNKENSDLFERYVRVVETGQPHDIELYYNAEGISAWVRNMAVKLGDGVAISFSDITARKRTEVAQRLLAQAGQVLASPLDYQTRLEQVAQLAVPLLADWCAVNLYDENWTVHHIAVTHVDPAKVELAREVQRRYPTPREELLAQSHPWQQGRSQLVPEINEVILKAGAQNEEHLQILRDLQLHSAMIVPLLIRERVLGLIAFFWAESNRRYDEQDLALTEELARRIAIAMDNARLYQAEQQARQTAEQTAERIAALQNITAAFAQTTTLAEVAKVVVERCIDILEAQGGVIALLDESGTTLETLDYVGYPPDMVERWRRYPVSSEAPLPDAVRNGEPVFVESTEMFTARYPHLMAAPRTVTYPALIGLPLSVEDRILGGIGLSFDRPQSFSPEERAFILALAQQCAQAVERARLFEAEQWARQAAEITAERLATLQAVTARLAQTMTPAEVVQTVFMYGLSTMDASGIVFASLNQTRDEFELVKAVGYPAEVMDSWQHFPLKSGLPMADVVQSGEPLYLESRARAAVLYPGFVATDRKNNHQAWAVLPLISEHEAIGAMSISFAQARVFDREDHAFLLTLSRQSAQALERARLFAVEQQARQEAEANQHRLALLAEMRERNRLAQDLHDTVAQALGYLNLKIGLTHTLLESSQFEQAQANFKELRQVINETYTDVREEIFYLRAKTLSDLSFLELLARYVEKYRRFYNLEIHLVQEADPALFEFSAETTSQLVRTIQEALINVRKHAQVNTATIRLGQENGEIRITIEDQGQGFDAEQAKTKTTSFGLQIMHERVASIGGSLEVNSAAGQGTRVIVRYRPRPKLNDVETF